MSSSRWKTLGKNTDVLVCSLGKKHPFPMDAGEMYDLF
jgi:hypothetical protein